MRGALIGSGRTCLDRARVPRALMCAAITLLSAASLGGCADRGTRTVEITVRHSRFEPATIHAVRGETVRFVIRNLDPIDHEFILGDQGVQRRHETGTEPHHGAVPGEVSVPAGETRTTVYAFTSPGELPFGCHLPGHWAYGMRGAVLIG